LSVVVQEDLRKRRILAKIVVGAELKVHPKKTTLVGFPSVIWLCQKLQIRDVNSVSVVEAQGYRRSLRPSRLPRASWASIAVALVEIERVKRQKTSRTASEFASASVTVLSCLKNPKYRFSNN
jgi:hypothetical protein